MMEKCDLLEGERPPTELYILGQSAFPSQGLSFPQFRSTRLGTQLSFGKRPCDVYGVSVSTCAFIVIAQYSVEKADKSH